jgi:hypothetical protein
MKSTKEVLTMKAKSCFTSTSRTLRKGPPKKEQRTTSTPFHHTPHESHTTLLPPLRNSMHVRVHAPTHTYKEPRLSTVRLFLPPTAIYLRELKPPLPPQTPHHIHLQAIREPTNLQQHHASNCVLALPIQYRCVIVEADLSCSDQKVTCDEKLQI